MYPALGSSALDKALEKYRLVTSYHQTANMFYFLFKENITAVNVDFVSSFFFQNITEIQLHGWAHQL